MALHAHKVQTAYKAIFGTFISYKLTAVFTARLPWTVFEENADDERHKFFEWVRPADRAFGFCHACPVFSGAGNPGSGERSSQ